MSLCDCSHGGEETNEMANGQKDKHDVKLVPFCSAGAGGCGVCGRCQRWWWRRWWRIAALLTLPHLVPLRRPSVRRQFPRRWWVASDQRSTSDSVSDVGAQALGPAGSRLS